jgi:cobalt transporter subunit CbtA
VAQLRRLIWVGVLAGLLVGLIVTVIQSVTIYPLLRHAEQFETAAPAAHDHHGDAEQPAWEPSGTLERIGFETLTNIVIGVGFGLLLAGLFGLRDSPVGLRRGCVWGAAGFLCFALAPALGLPPALPGAAEGALSARQLWWLLAAGSTAGGLAALVRGDWRWRIAGIALLVLPHVVGAPSPGAVDSTVPAELAHRFVILSLGTSALFWLLLGASAGWLYDALRARDRASPTTG